MFCLSRDLLKSSPDNPATLWQHQGRRF